MRFLHYMGVLLLLCLNFAVAQTAPQPIALPHAFNGWVMVSTASPAPPQLNPDQQALLTEFGLDAASEAHYQQNGRNLDLTVFRFPDYTGAYGSFTFFREPNMLPQKIGDQAASGVNHVLFFHGNFLVDAKFDSVSAMTLSQLRGLDSLLPIAKSSGHPPVLPKYLPPQNGDLLPSTIHYAIGPIGLKLSGAPLDASQVGFKFSPEIVTANYRSAAGQGTLTLISYPTPQIAIARLHAIEPAFITSTLPGNQIKRSNSLLVLASGAFTAAEAGTLLASVSYDGDITWNEPTKPNPKDNVLGLLSNVIILSVILGGFMFVIGLFFGGFRLLYFKFRPEKQEAYERSKEMIRLDLR
ncbi:MAG: DUF6599 family protein [Acidobacteriaceae bacterium]